jgi:hypothetical protein
MNRIAWLSALSMACAAQQPRITQDELVRRTQALFDAVAPGDKAPWQEAFADDAMYFDEKGRAMDKKALVDDVQPLPKGYSGNIKLVRPRSHIDASIAVLSYDLDETEEIFGQKLTARYHATDTWLLRDGRWRIVSGQVFRYYADPAEGPADERRYARYAGTYELAPGAQARVKVDGGKLFLEREGRPPEQLFPESGDLFFRKGVEGRRLFRFGPDGKVDAMIDRRNDEDVVWKKVG